MNSLVNRTKKIINWGLKILDSKIVVFIVTISTLAALVLATIQTTDLTNQTAKLEKISDELPTRFLAQFPYHMGEINRLLKETLNNEEFKDTITIFQDVLVYGMYSNPKEFEKYIVNILSLRDKGKIIEIFVYNDVLKKENRLMQFLGERYVNIVDFSDSVKKKMEKEPFFDPKEKKDRGKSKLKNKKFDEFIKYPFAKGKGPYTHQFKMIEDARNGYLEKININQDKINKDSLTCSQFFGLLDTVENIVQRILTPRSTYSNISIIHCDKKFTIYCWYNGEHTIFSMSRVFQADELAYKTRDKHFFTYVETMKRDYEKRAVANTK